MMITKRFEKLIEKLEKYNFRITYSNSDFMTIKNKKLNSAFSIRACYSIRNKLVYYNYNPSFLNHNKTLNSDYDIEYIEKIIYDDLHRAYLSYFRKIKIRNVLNRLK